MDGQSLTEVKGGSGGGNTNWKAISDVKNEHLGHGDKVHTHAQLLLDALKTFKIWTYCYSGMILQKIFKDKLKDQH